MTARIVTREGVREVSDFDFFRRAFGRAPRVRTAEENARLARARLIETVHKAAYLVARREREQVIREGRRDGETYEEFHQRMNDPFCRAANKVNAAMAEMQRRAAA